jgi:flagellar motor switch protein FliG
LGQASPEVKEKLLTNVSEPVRAFIETQLAASEKVPSKEIAKVQREFLETTKAAIEKATEEVRENIEAAREQIIQIYQSER